MDSPSGAPPRPGEPGIDERDVDGTDRSRATQNGQRRRRRLHTLHLHAKAPEGAGEQTPRRRARADDEPWYVSPAGVRLFGYPEEVFRENHQLSLECIHPEDRPRVQPALRDIKEAYDVKYRIVRGDGEVRWVRSRSYPLLSQSGELVRITGFTEDVTDTERIRRALETSEHKLRQIFDSSLDAIAINRREGGAYLEINTEFERISGFAADDVVGKSPAELGIWADLPTARALLRELEANGVLHNAEVELRRKDGRRLWALFSAVRMDLDGVPSVVSWSWKTTPSPSSS